MEDGQLPVLIILKVQIAHVKISLIFMDEESWHVIV